MLRPTPNLLRTLSVDTLYKFKNILRSLISAPPHRRPSKHSTVPGNEHTGCLFGPHWKAIQETLISLTL